MRQRITLCWFIILGSVVGADAQSRSGFLLFTDPGQRFSIEWDPAAHAAWSGKTVIAGIRPEAFSSCPVESACVKGRVEVVEPTGPDTMVVVDIAGTKVTVRLGARERPAPGQTLGLRIAPAVLSLFDPASTHSIA